MDVRIENEIMKEDPVFYRERGEDCTKTAMCWGIECGDGWRDPLMELARKTRTLNSVLAPLNRCLVGKQVKQKWAGLRVYWDMEFLDPSVENVLSEDDQRTADTACALMDDAVMEAERECEWTCEECGYKGAEWRDDIVTTSGGWMQRLCVKCAIRPMMTDGVVRSFRNGLQCLGPFASGLVRGPDGRTYGCFIGMYYSMLYPEHEAVFSRITSPREAQDIAVDMGLPRDDDYASNVMRICVAAKCADARVRETLLLTGKVPIVHSNYCHENYWGSCQCDQCGGVSGKNMYGRILMEARDQIEREEGASSSSSVKDEPVLHEHEVKRRGKK